MGRKRVEELHEGEEATRHSGTAYTAELHRFGRWLS